MLKTKPYIITLLGYSQPQNLAEVYRVFLIAELHPAQYIAEIHLTLLPCWGFPNPNTLQSCFQAQYKFEVYPVFLHCWDVPNF